MPLLELSAASLVLVLHSELLTLASISLASLSFSVSRWLLLKLRLRVFRTGCPGTRARRLRESTIADDVTSLAALLTAILEPSVQLSARSTGSCWVTLRGAASARYSASIARCSRPRRSRSADAARPPGELGPRSWLEAFIVIRRSGDTASLGRPLPGCAACRARRAAALGVRRSSEEPRSDSVDMLGTRHLLLTTEPVRNTLCVLVHSDGRDRGQGVRQTGVDPRPLARPGASIIRNL
jgi:hypothetical protein